ncbi:unnamed protein product [Parascedosporium putredinis]|uniref:Uncharacterized protein n=1 Tax=Parascedosporium putredinis TaxID=1442378 RepID=A0A9P1GY66_9PEZI|nr:unnamed protein product [Parascedosporium putredinis]CAI7990484.1 unnamed protein product [Parascedosporium putredinis]
MAGPQAKSFQTIDAAEVVAMLSPADLRLVVSVFFHLPSAVSVDWASVAQAAGIEDLSDAQYHYHQLGAEHAPRTTSTLRQPVPQQCPKPPQYPEPRRYGVCSGYGVSLRYTESSGYAASPRYTVSSGYAEPPRYTVPPPLPPPPGS